MRVDRDLFMSFLILFCMVVFCLGSVGCANKVEVPAKVEQCFKDPKTGECTNEVNVTVKHVITIELPTVFTDQCKSTWNEIDYPDPVIRAAGYNKCISDYLKDLTEVIKNLNPEDLPAVPL